MPTAQLAQPIMQHLVRPVRPVVWAALVCLALGSAHCIRTGLSSATAYGAPDAGPDASGRGDAGPDAAAEVGGGEDATREDAVADGFDVGDATPDDADVYNEADATADTAGGPDVGPTSIQTVFVITMENHNWSQIFGSDSAPYLNGILSVASYAERYYNPPGIHPSLPNYLWMEAGTNFGIKNDSNPSSNHQSTTDHLVSQLTAAGISWRSYQEDISGTVCPLTGTGLYAPKHNPMVYFDDVTDGNDAHSQSCIDHVRPYDELADDLYYGTVARYNFITPNLCDDMHNSSGCATSDSVRNGDNWLSQELPVILTSDAYRNGGAVFIVWDESEGGDVPIGMIVLSPLARGGGYHNTIHYTHGSLLRTLEEIFDVPLLRDAQNQSDLSDLFSRFP